MKVEEIKDYVRKITSQEFSGHDYLHLERVLQNAELLMQSEIGYNKDVIIAAVLLHDLIDEKLTNTINETIDDLRIKMREWGLADDERAEVLNIMTHMSYAKNLEQHHVLNLDGQIVQDADRLDALGAIGIGRAFAYGGHANNLMYNPNEEVRENMTKVEYRKNSTVINHFYEKLLKLESEMNTATAKKIAARRTAFMRFFLDEFSAEVHGEK